MAKFIKTTKGLLNVENIDHSVENPETGELEHFAGHGESMGKSEAGTADLATLTADIVPGRGETVAVLHVERQAGKRPNLGDVKVEQSDVLAWRIQGHDITPIFVPGTVPNDDGYQFLVASGRYISMETGRRFDDNVAAQKWVLEQEKSEGAGDGS